MKTLITTVALLMLMCLPINALGAQRDSLRAALIEVDKAIKQKQAYHKIRQDRIEGLKRSVAATKDTQKKYDLCGVIFMEYLHYQADSALYYIKVRKNLAEELHRADLIPEITINKAEVMGVMGMYNEAIWELESLQPLEMNDTIRAYYFRTYRACYGWVSDYIVNNVEKKKYLERTEDYRDSIVSLASLSTDYEIQLAEKLLFEGHADEALEILKKHSCVNFDNLRHKAYLHFTFAEVYEVKGDAEAEVYHLAKAATLDLKSAVREYAALQKLAKRIFAAGDIDRAYRYLDCAMEDAVDCNARLRSLEVSEIYPIIDKAYKDKERQERRSVRIALICVSVLSVLLIALAVYLYLSIKRLHVMRRELHEANVELVDANKSLTEAGKIKEVYIARYLERCVAYLEKLEQYRRSLEKLAMASKIEDLFKAIRSEQFLRDERKNFYTEFDKSFLDLFPTFIADFNNLLTEDGKIFPKQNELLNTELRIFALIRLGVTDSNKIAHFLGYSLATVYNYRSKIRNRAVIDKDRFEQAVAVL